jgi:hypothetical protein
MMPRLGVRHPRQVIAQDIDRDGREHKEQADPDAPITMRAFPVRIRLMMNAVASRGAMLVRTMFTFIYWHGTSIVCKRKSFSIAVLYSPRRAAWLHRAR